MWGLDWGHCKLLLRLYKPCPIQVNICIKGPLLWKSTFSCFWYILDYKESQQHREKVKPVTMWHSCVGCGLMWCSLPQALWRGTTHSSCVFKSHKVHSKTPTLSWRKGGGYFHCLVHLFAIKSRYSHLFTYVTCTFCGHIPRHILSSTTNPLP